MCLTSRPAWISSTTSPASPGARAAQWSPPASSEPGTAVHCNTAVQHCTQYSTVLLYTSHYSLLSTLFPLCLSTNTGHRLLGEAPFKRRFWLMFSYIYNMKLSMMCLGIGHSRNRYTSLSNPKYIRIIRFISHRCTNIAVLQCVFKCLLTLTPCVVLPPLMCHAASTGTPCRAWWWSSSRRRCRPATTWPTT